MNVRPIRTRIFREGEDLIAFITKHIPKLKDGSILVVTSKIAALSEGRTVEVRGKAQKEKLIREESEWAIESFSDWWLTIRDGMFTINAGIDKSNADGKIVLLPKDSFRAATRLRVQLRRHYKVRKLGIIITDSRVAPLRRGVFGMALGYAGFKGLRDYRGKSDIFGRKLRVTQLNVADSLATAAALEMGEGAEQRPLGVIENAPVEFCENVNKRELRISPKRDIYQKLFGKLLKH
jgi:dihydrofolate synthase / folylpolyglutamate synthase